MDRNPEQLSKMFLRKYKDDPVRFDGLPGTTSFWTPSKLVQLYCLLGDLSVEPGQVNAVAAEKLRADKSTVTRKISSMDWDDFKRELEKLCSMSDQEFLDEKAEEYRLNVLAKNALKIRKNDITARAIEKDLEAKIIRNLDPKERIVLPPLKSRKIRRNRTPEHMVLLLSDQHVGLDFSKEDTGGLGEYNLEIYKKWIGNLRVGVADIYRLHSELYPIPELHVLCLGDNIQGMNSVGAWNPGYISSDLPADKQAAIASNMMGELLATWSGIFEKVNFVGLVGNHGRVGAIKETEKVRVNWDNIVYSFLARDMSKHHNVAVSSSGTWWARRNINGTEFAMIHGDNMKSSPNSIKSEEQRMQSLLYPNGGTFNVLVAGHFHSHYDIETTNGRVILNGAFVGGDIYSMKSLSTKSKPTQTVMGVHPEHGITWKYCLDLSANRNHSQK